MQQPAEVFKDRAGDSSGPAAPRRVSRFHGWRERMRSDPRTARPYRLGVGVVGVVVMLVAAAIGWLPGPGGIPLFLVGLAILASEFAWARRALDRVKAAARRLEERARRRSRWGQAAIVASLLAAGGVAMWLGLAVVGVPGWLPNGFSSPLLHLPWVDPAL